MKLFKVMDTMFDNFDNSVQTYLAKAFNSLGLKYTNTQIFNIIFTGIKGVMQNILFYIEDAFTEQNVFTATRRNSIYSLAKISGFEPSYGTSSGGILLAKLHINNGLNKTKNNLFIKNHTHIINKNTGVIYSVILPTDYYIVNVSNPLVEYQLRIQQGTFIKYEYVAQGNALETIHITSLGLFDRNYIEVFVDGELWDETACLYDMYENSHTYTIQIGYDNTFDVIFGDGLYGQKLRDGQNVRIEYLQHNGLIGNIFYNESVKFEFADSGSDTLGNTVNINEFIDLSINTYISGGNNADSIGFIRNMIGMNSRSLVYSTTDNMKLFLSRFSFIGYTNCYASLVNNKIYIIALQNIENLYKDDKSIYYTIDENDLYLSTDQKNMVLATLSNSKHSIAGFNVEFINPLIRKYSIVCYIKPNSTYNKDIISDRVKSLLLDYFINIKYDVNFISKSDLINLILNNDTDNLIQSIDLNFISEYNEMAYASQEYIEYLSNIDYYQNNYVVNKYNMTNTPGLDAFGNISLNTIIEIPKLASVKYYINKESRNMNDFIQTDPIEIYFI